MRPQSTSARLALGLVTAFLCAVAVAIAAPVVAQQTYVLTDVGPSTEPVGPNLQLAINASGQIAGTSPVNADYAAWVWKPSSANASTGTFAWLPVPSGTQQSWAEGINSSGQIVGWRRYPSGTTKVKGKTVVVYTTAAVEWQSNGSEVDLPAGFGTQALAINDSGEIVGTTSLLVNGKIYPLPGFRAESINNSGQVAGFFDGNGYGYLWTPSSPNGTSGSYVTFPFLASQVNNLGQVVGSPYNDGGAIESAALFSILTGVQILPPPSGVSVVLAANSINNLGQVVGLVAYFSGPYLWDSTHGTQYLTDPTRFTILNSSGWSLGQVLGINDYGQIVGCGTNPNGVGRAFLLTPQ